MHSDDAIVFEFLKNVSGINDADASEDTSTPSSNDDDFVSVLNITINLL